MHILNFAHPITSTTQEQIEQALGVPVTIVNIPTQLDIDKPFAGQAKDLTDAVGWGTEDWQTLPFIINPPGMASAAFCILAEIHGRCGYFPTTLRLKSAGKPPIFVFAELIDLHLLRNTARTRR